MPKQQNHQPHQSSKQSHVEDHSQQTLVTASGKIIADEPASSRAGRSTTEAQTIYFTCESTMKSTYIINRVCIMSKWQPPTLSIVQFIFFFWSFEISGNILRNPKIYMFRTMYSKQFLLFGLISVALLKFEITVSIPWLSLPIH